MCRKQLIRYIYDELFTPKNSQQSCVLKWKVAHQGAKLITFDDLEIVPANVKSQSSEETCF